MTDIEREALDFLKRWLAWAQAGAVTGEFRADWGLCSNASILVEDWLEDQFLGMPLPFGADYFPRAIARTQHECPKRLAWVRAKIAEMESENG